LSPFEPWARTRTKAGGTTMSSVPRYLKGGLGGDPRDNIRALEALRGSRMQPQEAEAWLCVLEATPKEVGAIC
jgi:hypothetical protein